MCVVASDWRARWQCKGYGVESNRRVLETLVRYSHEESLSLRKLDVDKMFARSPYDLSEI